ncbi:MAG: arsenate reductase family protein [Negativicutes bacterium]|nr:arsenate reductase family protein [Negativicutes bacterium]
MSVLFVEYPKCGTCQKAKKWLEDHKIGFVDRHIVEERPSAEEIMLWWQKSGLPLKKFFNTSGLLYKKLELKDKLPLMGEKEQIELLATDGMLVKRPVIVSKDFILIGFSPKEWEKALLS